MMLTYVNEFDSGNNRYLVRFTVVDGNLNVVDDQEVRLYAISTQKKGSSTPTTELVATSTKNIKDILQDVNDSAYRNNFCSNSCSRIY